jgi:hypothetical protein
MTTLSRIFGDVIEYTDQTGTLEQTDVVIISGDTAAAKAALKDVGFGDVDVRDRRRFYAEAQRQGKTVLTIDDELFLAMMGSAYVLPQDPNVRATIEVKAFAPQPGN